MPDTNSPEPVAPPPESNLFGLIGNVLVQSGRTLTPWAQQLALAADQFQRAMADLARRLAPLLEALREWMQSPEMGRFMQGLAAMGEVMECAPSYCAPYDRELARLGLPPLTKDEQRDFILIAVLLGGRQAQQLGQRVPLVEVALAAERHDIAAAVVMERKLTQDVIHQLERDNSRPEGDLLADAYLELRESILPSIRRRIGRIPMRDTRRIARPLLKQVARDAYLLKAIRRAVVRRLERETQGMEGAPWDEEARHKLAQLKHRLAGDDSELNWDVERALASFLARPRVSELDRKLVQELRQSPESSARQIALCIGESVRTVQHHRRTLVDYVRKQLNT